MKEYIILTLLISMLCGGFYTIIKDRHDYYWHRKNWIDLKEHQYLVALGEQKEWESEMKDEELSDFERLVECEEVKLWD